VTRSIPPSLNLEASVDLLMMGILALLVVATAGLVRLCARL
jgi:hypothetical protein